MPGPVLDMETQEPPFVGDMRSDTNTRETIALRSPKEKGDWGGTLEGSVPELDFVKDE